MIDSNHDYICLLTFVKINILLFFAKKAYFKLPYKIYRHMLLDIHNTPKKLYSIPILWPISKSQPKFV